MTILNVFSLLGGLGLFLYGIDMMGNGLKTTAGDKLKSLLERITSNRLVAVLVGMLVTAVIQASAAVTVMAVGFVNAGLMTMSQAFGIMLGANIGTTITAWIISFNITSLAPLFIILGVVPMLFMKNEKAKSIGVIITGFGLLFMGLNLMGSSMAPLKNEAWFVGLMTQFQNPILGVLVGIVVTTIIQSSSAAVGILQTLAAQGLVSLNAGLYIVLGCNIGTCITTLLAGIGTSVNAKRTAILHLFNKSFGAIIFSILIYLLPLTDIVANMAPGNPMVQIANFHTIFNILNTLLLLPLGNTLIKLVTNLVKDKGGADEEDGLRLKYLDERILETPAFAMAQLKKEMQRMYGKAVANYDRAVESFFNQDKNLLPVIMEEEEKIDFIQREITPYLVKIQSLSTVSDDHKATVLSYHNLATFIERIGDHDKNIAEFAVERQEKGAIFSDDAIDELKNLCGIVRDALVMAQSAFENGPSHDTLAKTYEYENMVEHQHTMMRENHIARLNNETCNARAGMIFTDICVDLERITFHAMKIARHSIEAA
ncbi:MAG: Na/Pi cotransporter family protein [Clostridiales bacterium]|nr:Na/Pi cotransporter family protein [Clostridiales bacterium]